MNPTSNPTTTTENHVQSVATALIALDTTKTCVANNIIIPSYIKENVLGTITNT